MWISKFGISRAIWLGQKPVRCQKWGIISKLVILHEIFLVSSLHVAKNGGFFQNLEFPTQFGLARSLNVAKNVDFKIRNFPRNLAWPEACTLPKMGNYFKTCNSTRNFSCLKSARCQKWGILSKLGISHAIWLGPKSERCQKCGFQNSEFPAQFGLARSLHVDQKWGI